jgi:hypothetical protein
MGKNCCQYLKEGALLYAIWLPIDCYCCHNLISISRSVATLRVPVISRYRWRCQK